MAKLATLAGWGRLAQPGREILSEDLAAITGDVPLTRGLARSYGDSSLPPPDRSATVPVVASSVLADRLLAFDPATGLLRAEAGLSLYDLVHLFLPRGWMPPVVPGTQFVTLGGAVASDIHGKNHHVSGTFGRHVTWLRMRLADGRIVETTRELHPDLFLATIGGMGLTGHILEVEVRMVRVPSPWILGESFRVPNLRSYLDALRDAAAKWPMTVGWIDCVSRGERMGRGILMCGRWAEPSEAPSRPPAAKRRIAFPFELPFSLVNGLSVPAFNALYFHRHPSRPKRGIVHPESFFYPLDAVLRWNLIYGRRGFTQYQCVLPEKDNPGASERFMAELTRRGGASFLCVIKDCGDEGEGILSFPKRGISVATDLAVGPDTPKLVRELNEVVIAEGGRVYLTKDAFTTAEQFARMEPRLPRFREIQRRWDPEGRLASAQSVRLGLTLPPPTRTVAPAPAAALAGAAR